MSPKPFDDGWRPLHPDMSREEEERHLARLRVITPAEKFAEIFRLNQLEEARIDLRIRALRPLASGEPTHARPATLVIAPIHSRAGLAPTRVKGVAR